MGKKKNQRDINRAALIGPSSWVTGYMGASHMILCGSVCRRINPSDQYRVRWVLLSICDHWSPYVSARVASLRLLRLS